MVLPTQTGLLDETVGAAGVGRITTVVVPEPLGHPAPLTVKE
jgi:hypothetical protein